ncbi:hypothetical protein [Escherichia coli]|uniref:hypothetical protein n=1 Tax=Escherichia coli TaxID=562 RepID=UPI001F59346F|nr:hypothetical protein [Escherichia coli]
MAQIREILISESTWEEMTCLFAPSLSNSSPLKIILWCYGENREPGLLSKYQPDSLLAASQKTTPINVNPRQICF